MARAEPLPVQSIKQPQLDLHSRLHNPGTYRVKAPGRSPLSRPGRKEQADDPHHGGPSIRCRRPRRAIQCQDQVDTEPATAEGRERRVRLLRPPRHTRYAKRVAAGDVDALADMTGLATDLDEAITQAVFGLRGTGYSWAEIADRLGVTRQAAQQRWGRL